MDLTMAEQEALQWFAFTQTDLDALIPDDEPPHSVLRWLIRNVRGWYAKAYRCDDDACSHAETSRALRDRTIAAEARVAKLEALLRERDELLGDVLNALDYLSCTEYEDCPGCVMSDRIRAALDGATEGQP